MRALLTTRLVGLIGILSLSACSQHLLKGSSKSKNSAATAIKAHKSSEFVYNQWKASLDQDPEATEMALDTVRQMSIAAYYQSIVATATNDAVQVDQVVISGSRSDLEAKESVFLELDGDYGSVGAWWDEKDYSPLNVSLEAFQAALLVYELTQGFTQSSANFSLQGSAPIVRWTPRPPLNPKCARIDPASIERHESVMNTPGNGPRRDQANGDAQVFAAKVASQLSAGYPYGQNNGGSTTASSYLLGNTALLVPNDDMSYLDECFETVDDMTSLH